MKLLEGEIAAVDGRLMTGWIAAPEGMAAPVLVEFAAGDQLLGSTLAQLDKSPAPPRLVFEFLLPGCLVDGRARDIAARIGGAPVALRNARHRLGTPVLVPTGCVDQITKAAKVEGWAWYPDQPGARVELEFLADDVVIGSAIADLSRPDLAKAGIGDGRHSFSWPLPYDVLVSPGETIISVRDKTTGTTLRRPLVFKPQNAADALVAFAAQQMDVQPDEAEAALGEALRLAPENIQVLLGLARCARKRGDRAAALGHFETAARLAPEDVWRWLDVAEDLRELGRLDEAEAALREALRLAPENIHVHIGCARCARKRGDRVAALGHFEEAARLAPEDVWRWLDVAEDLRELGRLDEAEAALREALRLAPENIHVHIGFARCARKRGDRAVALGHFEEAARLAPGDVWRWLDVAEDLRELGRLDEAEAALREALRLAPENIHVHMGFARCARKRGDRAAALGHFETAARLVPEDIYPRLEIAQEQRDAGDTDAARQTAEAILQSHPNEFQVIWSLAHTERLAGKHEAAREWFQAAVAAAPENVWALVELANEEHTLGHLEDSNRRLARALELDPLHPGAVVCKAQQALVLGDLDKAYEIYRGAVEKQPQELTFQFGVLDALSGLGRLSEALSQLDALEVERGVMPELRVKRIALLRAAGHYYEALEIARASTEVARQHFNLWIERFYTEILFGDVEAMRTCLDRMPAATLREKSMQARCAGALAESEWLLEDAVAGYEAAAGMYPEDIGLQSDLVRTKLLLADVKGVREHLRLYCSLQDSNRRLRGESLNISQNIYGQILDEYAIDQVVAESLEALRPLPPEARVKELLPIAASNPDNTAVAVSLLVAMRQSGGLRYKQPVPGGPVVTKNLFQFWDSEDVPGDVLDLMERWSVTNPDYKHTRFTDKSAQDYLAARFPPPVLTAYRRVTEPAQKADIFRLAVLVLEGGVYTDADDRSLRALDTIIPVDANLVLYQENLGSAGNNFIAAAPGHPVLVAALQFVVAAVNRGDTDAIWLLSGPGLLTRALVQTAIIPHATGMLPDGMVVLDRPDLHKAIAEHCRTSYKLKNKHWANLAFARRPPGARVPAPGASV